MFYTQRARIDGRITRRFHFSSLVDVPAGCTLEDRTLLAPAIFRANPYGGPLNAVANVQIGQFVAGTAQQGDPGANASIERSFTLDNGTSQTAVTEATNITNTVAGPAGGISNTVSINTAVGLLNTDRLTTNAPPNAPIFLGGHIFADGTATSQGDLRWTFRT
jgi:hypothetical protein